MMNKFKVGDKVMINSDDKDYDGVLAIVKEVGYLKLARKYIYYVDTLYTMIRCKEENLELIERKDDNMSKFNVGDKVRYKLNGEITKVTGVHLNELQNKYFYDTKMWEYTRCSEEDLELIEAYDDSMELRIKYFEGAERLKQIEKGNWIDVYANEDVFVEEGDMKLIPLGFALELPKGWEGHLAPRSSTFKTWGVIETNSVGVVDDTYIGDNDQWHMPVYCLQGRDTEEVYLNDFTWETCEKKGTWIHKGDKIGQFRIMEVMPKVKFKEVEVLGNEDRSGFGSTGTR